MDTRASRIEQRLSDELELLHLEVLDESDNHSGPANAQSHFKVVAVADEFAELTRIKRHRLVNGLLRAEFDGGMHALAIHTFTVEEWADRFGEAPLSPPCAGGSEKSAKAKE